MARDIKTTIELDGASKFNKSLKSVDTELKKLSSEMKAVTSTFDKNKATTTDLGNTNKVLVKQIEQQTTKVKALAQAVKDCDDKYKEAEQIVAKAAEEFGENSDEVRVARQEMEKWEKATSEYTIKLNYAKSNLNSFNRELQANNNQIVKQESNLKETKKSLGSVNIDLSKITPNLKDLAKVSVKGLGESLEKVAKAVGKISVASIKAVTSSVEVSVKAFEKYAVAIGTAGAAIATYSTKIGTDFTSQMSTVQSLLGFTENSEEQLAIMDVLEEKAKQVGATTQFTASEAGKALEYMAMAGWKDTEMLEGMDGIVNLTIASGEELASTSDIVTDAITAFGLSASDSTRFADVLAATVTNSNTNVSMLGEAFKYIGPMANTLGYSIEDVSLALGLMANAGVKGEQAGNALKTSLSRLASPTKSAQAVIDRLGISLADKNGNTLGFADMLEQLRGKLKGVSAELVDADGNLKEYEELEQELAGNNEQLQLISDASNLFGKNQVASMLSLINATDEDFKSLRVSIDDCTGAAEAMAEVRLDNLTGDVEIFSSSLEALGLSIFESLESPLREVVQTGSDLLNDLNKSVQLGFNPDKIVGNIYSFGDKITEQIQVIFPGVLGAINIISKSLNALLFNIVDTIIETFSEYVGIILPTMIDSFWHMINVLIEKITTSLPELADVGANVIITFANGLTSASDNIQNSLPTVINALSKGIKKALPAVLKMGGSIFQTIAKGIVTALPELLSIGTEILETISTSLEGIPDIVAIKLSADDIIDGIGNLSDVGVEIIDKILSGFGENQSLISSISKKLAKTLKKVMSGLVSSISKNLPIVLDSLLGITQDLLDAVLDALTDGDNLQNLSNAVVKIITSLVVFVADNAERVTSIALELIIAISDALTDNADIIIPAIAEIIEGIVVGISKNLDPLINSLLSLIDSIVKAVTQPDTIVPLMNAITILVVDVINAIIKNIGPLVETAVNLLLAIFDVFLKEENLTVIIGGLAEIVTALLLAIPGIVMSLADAIAQIYDAFKTRFEECDWESIGESLMGAIVGGVLKAWEAAKETILNVRNSINSALNGELETHESTEGGVHSGGGFDRNTMTYTSANDYTNQKLDTFDTVLNSTARDIQTVNVGVDEVKSNTSKSFTEMQGVLNGLLTTIQDTQEAEKNKQTTFTIQIGNDKIDEYIINTSNRYMARTNGYN